MAMMSMPAQPGTLGLTALMSCAPTMVLTDDQPMHARTLKQATAACYEFPSMRTLVVIASLLSFTPHQPNQNLDRTI